MDREELKARRISLRHNETKAETALWKILKAKQIDNIKFRRQHSIHPYILNFYCISLKLCIELDGCVHDLENQHIHDEIRTKYLNEKGITVFRFTNELVYNYPQAIIQCIQEFKRNPQFTPGLIKDEYFGKYIK